MSRWRALLLLCLSAGVAGCYAEGISRVVAVIQGTRTGIGFYQWAQSSRQAEDPPEPAPHADPPARVQFVAAPEPLLNRAQAFAEGYKAYTGRDFAQAAERLRLAADSALGDYALFYLGCALREQADLDGATASFKRLLESYPRSVLAGRAELELAGLALKRSDATEARTLAARLLAHAGDPEVAQGALMLSARASIALNDPRSAYQTLLRLRREYPHAGADAEARLMTRGLLASHSELADLRSVAYRAAEAELLLAEGDSASALKEVEAGLGLAPSRAERAELKWLEARAASRSDPGRERRALAEYLKLAPRGPSAPAALMALGRLYWHQDDVKRARSLFARLAANFPASPLAAEAMLKAGRILEEERSRSAARRQYQRLAARYPQSEAAAEARFRIPWTFYLEGKFETAARRFGLMRPQAATAAERDMFDYWHARALEKVGRTPAAREILERLALSSDSNYYPALAAWRVGATPPVLPAALARDPAAQPPSVASPEASFHLSRALALRELALGQLEKGELLALRGPAYREPKLRDFVLVELQATGAYSDAITMATGMAARGELKPEVAERVRYPRAYWELLSSAARERALEPYLLLALTRQESLFNPAARSVSDARGLMQMLPATAAKVAAQSGVPADNLDLYDPALNVRLGTAYLKSLFLMFNGDQFKAVAAYNAGEHAVQRWNLQFGGEDDEWVENIDYRETREYVKKVIGGLREYRLLYASGYAT